MYILLKSDKVIQADKIAIITMTTPNMLGYSFDGKDDEPVPINDVARISDDRPELITWDEAQRHMYKYLVWSQMADSDDEAYVDMIKNTCHDIMDYLCHTKQVLTPNGFLPGSPEPLYTKSERTNLTGEPSTYDTSHPDYKGDLGTGEGPNNSSVIS